MPQVIIRKETATRFSTEFVGGPKVRKFENIWSEGLKIHWKKFDGSIITEDFNQIAVYDIAAVTPTAYTTMEQLLDLLETLGYANFKLGGASPIPQTIASNLKLQNNITFDNVVGDYFGTIASPRTGALTFDTSGAVRGGIAIVYYMNDTLNMPTPWLTSGTFNPNEINKIYLERDGEGLVTCNILNFFSNLPLAPTSFSLTESTF